MAREGSRGLKSSVTTSILSDVKDKAIRLGIPFARTLEDALVARIEDLERAELASNPVPGHPHLSAKEAT